MSQNLPVLSRTEVSQIASHLARHQEATGQWESPPPANGAPPIWESPETLVLLALLAWEAQQPTDVAMARMDQQGRDKARDWLQHAKPTETTQSITLHLLYAARKSSEPPAAWEPRINQLLKRQNLDGGWSQTPDLPSDAFATGQALCALSEAGITADRKEIQQAIAFLVSTQQPDGSWAMASRNHPGVESTRKPIRNPIPITYFGSAWATIGLVRFVPTPPDTAAKRQQAFDHIKAFHGKFNMDEQQPDKPVIRVDLGYYDLSDDEVSKTTQLVRAFPKLSSLEFKSKKLTDAGVLHLLTLPQLKHLSLENATITDVGLAQLKSLTQLETLNVKATSVTAAGVAALQQQLPKLKIER